MLIVYLIGSVVLLLSWLIYKPSFLPLPSISWFDILLCSSPSGERSIGSSPLGEYPSSIVIADP